MLKRNLLVKGITANISLGIVVILLLAYIWDRANPLVAFLVAFILGALVVLVLIKKGILNVRHSSDRGK